MTPQRFASGRFGGVARLPGHQVGRVISNLFGGGSARELLDSAPFCSELLYTAIPQRAASGTTATFTRATTSTWPNNDGYLVTGVAGEIGFVGARRVRNWIQAPTENWSSAGWVKSGISVSGNRLTATGANGVIYDSAALGMGTGRTAVGSVTLSRVTGTGNIDVSTNGGTTWTTVSVTGARVSVSLTGNINGQFAIRIVTSGDAVEATYPQLEDVTSQTTQTAGEYVSVGVPSDWAGDELVTNGTFDTDTTWIKESGWTIGGGVATHAAGVSATLYQVFNFVAGATYVFSWDTVISAGAVSLRVGGGYLIPIDFKSASGTYTATYTAVTTATDLLGFVCDAPFAGTIDNFSVKPAIYHGSMVDGVKCFPTDLSGNPIPAATMLGYQAEGARTNLCLQSNAFTTTWTAYLTPSATQNAVGPDGAVSAWTLTDNDAGDVEEIYQDILLTAAAYTLSILVKKTVGATTFPALRWFIPGLTQCAACTIDTNNGVATAWTAMTGFTMASGVSASCSSYNTDYWRVSLTKTGTAALHRVELFPAVTSNATQSTGAFSAAITGSAVFYGAQVELGSFASSYIATTTIAVARNADVLTYSSAGNIDGTKGWCYAEFDVSNDSDGNQNIILGSDVAGVFPLYAQPSLGNVRTLDGTNAPIAQSAPMSGIRKGVGTWGGSTLQCAHNGVVSTTTAFDGNMNVTSVVRVGEDNAGNSHLFGTIRNVRIGQRQLSASELGAITS